MTKSKPATYVTTYCNQAHYLKTGRPVNHNCYVLPVKGLELEREGKYEEALEVFIEWSRKGKGSPR